ncbi:unnamed protein product [Thelazia callipaeda]|uniref:Cytochrome b5 heme-binding domain-containing protein n=1 Tax=Thelazia callipaeda TaxID=103827 RepID=A0A0N5CPI6_THECL|nr:unnamed protein product [Thelazia callipaeda]
MNCDLPEHLDRHPGGEGAVKWDGLQVMGAMRAAFRDMQYLSCVLNTSSSLTTTTTTTLTVLLYSVPLLTCRNMSYVMPCLAITSERDIPQ